MFVFIITALLSALQHRFLHMLSIYYIDNEKFAIFLKNELDNILKTIIDWTDKKGESLDSEEE